MKKFATKSIKRFYSTHYDIVIMGGGLVGGVTAKNLQSTKFTKDLNILVIDPNQANKPYKPRENSTPLDLRTIAISPFSKNLFEKIGIWDRISPYAKEYHEMKVWDEAGSNIEFKEPNLGYIIENSIVTDALFDGSIPLMNEKVNKIQIQEEKVVLKMNNKEEITAKLLIGADGGNSFVRESLSFPYISWNYSQKALVSTVKTNIPNSTCYQKFLKTGPISMLPYGEYSNIVWSNTPENVDKLMNMDSESFINEMNEAFQSNNERLNFNALPPSPPFIIGEIGKGSFPLKRLHVKDYVKNRVALVGDSAHTCHPLAGQGVNLGFVDVHVLTEEIKRALDFGQDFGSIITLEKYGKPQKRRNELALNVLEGLKIAYDVNAGPFPYLRSLGVSLVNNFGPLKKYLIDQATGKDIKI